MMPGCDYQDEKCHTRMIVYALKLWNAGDESVRTGLGPLLDALQLPHGPYGCELEYTLPESKPRLRIDLTVWSDEGKNPVLALETKVDSGEGGSDDHQWQTDRMQDAMGRMPQGVKRGTLLTLGQSDYFHAGRRFRKLSLRDFASAVSQVDVPDVYLDNWKVALKQESELHDRIESGVIRSLTLKPSIREERLGFFATLDSLRAMLHTQVSWTEEGAPFVYPVGKSDCVMNFGRVRNKDNDLYMEINNNGRLHLKIDMRERREDEQKAVYGKAQARWQGILGSFDPIRPHRRTGQRRSLLRFDIGLPAQDGITAPIRHAAESRERILPILHAFLQTCNE